MAISSSGIGSGLDVNSIVQQLVAAERSSADTRLKASQSKAQVQLSALGTFKSSLSSLRTAVSGIGSTGAFSSLNAVSSNKEIFTASASGAVAGSYSLEVVDLAQAHKVASSTYANANSTVGTGSVTITVDGESFTVNLADGSNSLADLRNAINDSDDNDTVNATLINESGGTRLLLSSRETGAAQAIAVTSETSPSPGTSFISFTERQPAQDAHVRIEGYDRYSASNNVTSVIDGVTLNLVKAEPGTTATLNISTNNTAATEAAQNFIKQYNNYSVSALALTRYDSAKQQASALTGDSAVRAMSQKLRSLVGGQYGTTGYTLLSQVGIKSATDGTLSVDTGKLNEALAKDPAGVQALFSKVAEQMDTQIAGYVEKGGQLESKTDSLQSKLKAITRQQDSLNLRMERVEARYLAQFSALDTIMSQLQTTGNYLTQQLAALSSN